MTDVRTLLAAALLAVAAACSAPRDAGPAVHGIGLDIGRDERIQLVESWPAGTTLDHPDLPDTADVWIAMIDGARESIDFAQFYASNEPGSRLEDVVLALERAARRGVAIRWLAEEKFYATYPDTLERIARLPRAELRRFDVDPLMGGVLHAKYFVVDGAELFVGSPNFDWRSLEHIQELGVRLREPAVAGAFGDVFEADWALAGGTPRDEVALLRQGTVLRSFPVGVGRDADAVRVTPVFSPLGWLPDEGLWDLPRILGLIESARRTVRVQLLTFKTQVWNGDDWTDLEDALRAAAGRGVTVQLLLADWCKRRGTIETLQALQRVPEVEVRLATVPQDPAGFVPYARVVHAKYVVVDGERAWIGTSNWERSYFYESRNAGLILEGTALAGTLEAFFRGGWTSDYAVPVDPDATYAAPRIGE
jgi:phosphatidylserine/phosphatidylglycerophosphate/cardiolipin synthase-like enzyme